MVKEENIEYLHRALGSRGIGLTGVSRERVARWFERNDSLTLIEAMRVYMKEEGSNINLVVPYENLILGFNFTGINKRNVKQFKVNIINYLVTGEEVYLSQLKGNRYKGFVNSPYIHDITDLVVCYSDQDKVIEKDQDHLTIKMTNVF